MLFNMKIKGIEAMEKTNQLMDMVEEGTATLKGMYMPNPDEMNIIIEFEGIFYYHNSKVFDAFENATIETVTEEKAKEIMRGLLNGHCNDDVLFGGF